MLGFVGWSLRERRRCNHTILTQKIKEWFNVDAHPWDITRFKKAHHLSFRKEGEDRPLPPRESLSRTARKFLQSYKRKLRAQRNLRRVVSIDFTYMKRNAVYAGTIAPQGR